MITRERIEAEIARLEAEIVAIRDEANWVIALRQGAVQGLRGLLVEPEGQPDGGQEQEEG